MEAREHYHVHLSHLDNVVATAVGRYRIHEKNWHAEHPPEDPRPPGRAPVREPRTLANTVVRSWSWPCVLVFVRRWVHRDAFGARPEQAVPRALYLPDGRVVPTCIVLAQPDESLPPSPGAFAPASGQLGGGYSCTRNAQGVDRAGTLGCLVERGGTVFALTNQHVAGPPGEKVYAVVGGRSVFVGESAGVSVAQQTMASLFPGWSGERTLVKVDAGLVKIADLADWTSQVFGIGQVGEIVDVTPETLTLDLVGTPVRAFGGSSGPLEGEIQALFFRYQSMGGFDYVADLLIGPRRDEGQERSRRSNPRTSETHPGDSGTIWFHDPPRRPPRPPQKPQGTAEPAPQAQQPIRRRRLRPIAMQWGGERFVVKDGETSAYALATFLTTICRVLEVDLRRDWSLGHDEYWGKTAHFAIGWKACDLVRNRQLQSLLEANQPRIGFDDDRLGEGSAFRVGRGGFVPLADVPDYVWVSAAHGSPSGGPRAAEGQQHFADMDCPAADGGPSLMQMYGKDTKRLSAKAWHGYCRGFDDKGYGPEEGSLPFRVWQIYDAMVGFVRKGDWLGFVAAAGVLAHYVGDASQPLHSSQFHHGDGPRVEVGGTSYPAARDSDAFRDYKRTWAYKIHAIYEQQMLVVDAPAALREIDAALRAARGARSRPARIKGGHAAGLATVALMARAHKQLPPATILNADDATLQAPKRAARLWADPKVHDGTIAMIAEGTLLLAKLWESAWNEGNRGRRSPTGLGAFSETDVETRYRSPSFLPALTLEQMVASGKYEPPA